VFILKSIESWARHTKIENLYFGQFSYLLSEKNFELSNDPLEALTEAAGRSDIDGFSVRTGAIKIIASDRPIIFGTPEA